MKGTNTIKMNNAEMNRAIKYYLNNVQFKEAVEVQKVVEERNSGSFEITITEPKLGEVTFEESNGL